MAAGKGTLDKLLGDSCKLLLTGGGAGTTDVTAAVSSFFPADNHEVIITGTQSGLGIRIVGGQRASPSQEGQVLGVFIKEVIEGSLAERDGMFLQNLWAL